MTTIAQGNERLLRLAAVLDTADEKHVERGEPTYDQSALVDHKCGTPGCAWGHYRVIPSVKKRLGLTDNWGTLAEQEFAINYEQLNELFDYDGCNDAKTAKAAAKYIRSFVKRRT